MKLIISFQFSQIGYTVQSFHTGDGDSPTMTNSLKLSDIQALRGIFWTYLETMTAVFKIKRKEIARLDSPFGPSTLKTVEFFHNFRLIR